MPGVLDRAEPAPDNSTVGVGNAREGRGAWAGTALILAVYLVTFARTATFDFVWDDPDNFAHSELLRGPLSGVIRKGEHARSDPAYARMPKDLVPVHESYRPVSIASHWIDVQLFGTRPAPMHLHSVMLGALSIFLVAALARKLGLGLWLPALWALHPLHVEVFAYLSARSDLLAGILSLSALLLALRSAEAERSRVRVLWAAASGLVQLLSLFAKEANLGLPFAVLALAAARGRVRKSSLSVAAMILATAAYFPLRLAFMEGSSLPMAQHGALVRSLLDGPGIVLAYLESFFLPFSLSPDRRLWEPWVGLGWLALGLFLALCLWLSRKLREPMHADWLLAVMALVALAPMLLPVAVGIRSMGALSDRYIFFPFLFLAVAVVAAGRAVLRRAADAPAWLRRGPIAGWGALLLAVTWLELGAWKNEQALAKHAVAMEPDNPAALYRLATVATSRGQFAEALPMLERATTLDPMNPRALGNLAVTYLNLNRLADAKAVLRRMQPLAGATDKRFWYNVASVQLADGKHDKACAALGRALAIDPGYPTALAMRDSVCGPAINPARSATPRASPGESPRP